MRRSLAPAFRKVRKLLSNQRLGHLTIPRAKLLLEELEKREVLTTINLFVTNDTRMFSDPEVLTVLYGKNASGNFAYVNPTLTTDNVIDLNTNNAVLGLPFAFDTTANQTLSNSTGCTTLIVNSAQIGNTSAQVPAGIVLRMGSEFMLVTAVGGTDNKQWTVERGYANTTVANHAIGDAVEYYQYLPNYTLASLPGYNSATQTAYFPIDANATLDSGRMYFGLGSGSQSDVLVLTQLAGSTFIVFPPNAESAVDPNLGRFFDFVEPSYAPNGNGTGQLVMDTTQVDAFGFPITFSLANLTDGPPLSGTPGTDPASLLPRDQILTRFGTFISSDQDYSVLLSLSESANGTALRILSPASVMAQNPIQYESAYYEASSNILLFPDSNNVVPALVGDPVTNANIPLGTTITSVNLSIVSTGVSTTNGNNTVTIDLANTTINGTQSLNYFYVGMPMVGSNNANGVSAFPTTSISNVTVSGNTATITFADNATATNTGNVTLTFIPAAALMSANTTGASGNASANTTTSRVTIIANPEFDAANTTNITSLLNLNKVFDAALEDLFSVPGTSTLELSLLNPGHGKGAGFISNGDSNYYLFEGKVNTTFQATGIDNNLHTYTVLEFTASSNTTVLGNTPTLQVFMPFFSTNTEANANLPPPPNFYTNNNGGQGLLSITMSPGQMVFGNTGAFADNNQQTGNSADTSATNYFGLLSNLLGAIEDQLASALNRGVVSLATDVLDPGNVTANGTSLWGNIASYYGGAGQSDAFNRYAAFLHSGNGTGNGATGNIAVNRVAYGFAFDDSNDQSSTQTADIASSANITLNRFTSSPSPSTAIYAVGSGAGSVATVTVFNANNTQIATINPFGSFTGGARVAVGDVDNDGVQDVIIGAGPGGGSHLIVYSGTNFSTVLASQFVYEPTFTGGIYVAAGDIDNDGQVEIVTGAGEKGGPRVLSFEYSNGGLSLVAGPLGNFFAYDSSYRNGVTVAVGDVDGTGAAEIVTGVAMGGGPHVKVFQSTGNVYASFFAYDSTFLGGIDLAVGNFSGNNFGDIVVAPLSGMGPLVKVFNVQTSVTNPIASFNAFGPDFQGGVRLGTFDYDNDGQVDVLTGAGPTGGPEVSFFDGQNFSLLASFFAFPQNWTQGIHVS